MMIIPSPLLPMMLLAPWVTLNEGQARRAPWPGRYSSGVGALVIGLSSGPAVHSGS
ncbi:hypothetical protein [Paenibacillus polymyxa]|uniref:hypothetical protein n=1 Tax=Paenibacillus polymyxa TaxID=1406 RepID=UPI00130EBC96|nr:hypothetical protein [Paenibacillus polymyxa]